MNIQNIFQSLIFNTTNRKKFSVTSIIISVIALVVLIFCITMLLIVIMSYDLIKYSTLINDTGKIRGGIQRIIKLETANIADDNEILKIDGLLNNSINTKSNLFFHFKEYEKYSLLIDKLNNEWTKLKIQILEYRKELLSKKDLIKSSESIWIIANESVYAIEKTSHINATLYYYFSFIGILGIIILLAVLFATKIYIRDRIEYLADHDQLTGIYNRHFFLKFFEREILLTKRNNSTFALLMCDIDNFKKINDSFGHDIGDKVLKTVAETIQGVSRITDLVARFGGEEFIILNVSQDIENYYNYAEKIRKKVESITIINDIKVTISIGIAQYKRGMPMQEIIKKADEALYEAKKMGRNKTVLS